MKEGRVFTVNKINLPVGEVPDEDGEEKYGEWMVIGYLGVDGAEMYR